MPQRVYLRTTSFTTTLYVYIVGEEHEHMFMINSKYVLSIPALASDRSKGNIPSERTVVFISSTRFKGANSDVAFYSLFSGSTLPFIVAHMH